MYCTHRIYCDSREKMKMFPIRTKTQCRFNKLITDSQTLLKVQPYVDEIFQFASDRKMYADTIEKHFKYCGRYWCG